MNETLSATATAPAAVPAELVVSFVVSVACLLLVAFDLSPRSLASPPAPPA